MLQSYPKEDTEQHKTHVNRLKRKVKKNPHTENPFFLNNTFEDVMLPKAGENSFNLISDKKLQQNKNHSSAHGLLQKVLYQKTKPTQNLQK